jgi:hypothetical protein
MRKDASTRKLVTLDSHKSGRKPIFAFSCVGFLSALFLFGSCRSDVSLADEQEAIEYRIEDGSYAIVVPQKEGCSQEQTKQLAMRKAAELAKSYNYRYFVVQKESTVQVARTNQSSGANAPRNLYYESIQSGNFGREQIMQESQQYPQLLPAYKIIIQCYTNNPPPTAVDVCEMIKCQ